jgi:flagellar export protein FliJ
MAFQFRFKALLRYKEHLLSKAQIDLGEAMREYESTRLRMENLKEEQNQQRVVLTERQSTGMNAQLYLQFLHYLTFLEQQLLKVADELARLDQRVDAAREALLVRKKEVKMLEVLRENARLEYHRAMKKKEMKQTDEKATVSDSRKKMGLDPNNQEMRDGA